MKLCEICNVVEVNGRKKYCDECGEAREKERLKIADIKSKEKKRKEKVILFNENFNQINPSGLNLLPKRFNEISKILNTAYSSFLGLSWIEVLRYYNKEESLLEALLIEFDVFHEETGSQSVKKFAESIGSSGRFFSYLDHDIFRNRIDKKELKSSSRSNITIEDIRERLPQYLEDVVLLSNIYVNAEAPLLFNCLICDHDYSRRWKSVVCHNSGCPSCLRNGIKISKREIVEHVKEYDYRIINFIGGCADKGTIFDIECFRGHVYETNYREFNEQQLTKGGSCKRCIKEGYSVSRMAVKRDLLERMTSLGYRTEDEFNHTQETMTFFCDNNHKRVTVLNRIFNYPKCGECHDYVYKHTEDSVSRELADLGLEYVSGWINTTQYFTYRCECGEIDEGKYFYLLDGSRCFSCSTKRNWRYKDAYKHFQENDCELLEENYVGYHSPMKFKCSCGRISSKALGSFMYSPFCRECVVEAIPTGKYHHNWRDYLTDEDRNISRNLPGYNQWREDVLKRDNYTCQCCEEYNAPLVVHHKDGYHWCKERRIDSTNGVTLCNECHDAEYVDSFHFLYGNRNNTEEQYNEWLKQHQEENSLRCAN